jgi:hypothetical protein
MKRLTASTNRSSDSFAMTVVDPRRPAAISPAAKRNELSIHAPDAVARTSNFSTGGNAERSGLNGASEPK